MNSDQNLARTRRWAQHILEEDDLRTSEHVDAIGFHRHSNQSQSWLFDNADLNDCASHLGGQRALAARSRVQVDPRRLATTYECPLRAESAPSPWVRFLPQMRS